MAVKDEMLAERWGRVVCLSSVAALRPRKMQIHYASSKAALMALTRCCAEAFAPHVRVNCIAPGVVKTEMGELLGPAAIIRSLPICRWPGGRAGRNRERRLLPSLRPLQLHDRAGHCRQWGPRHAALTL